MGSVKGINEIDRIHHKFNKIKQIFLSNNRISSLEGIE